MGQCAVAPIPCAGVIFDLDDTLIPTREIDALAVAEAARSVAARAGCEADLLRSCFRAALERDPFPPEGVVRTLEDWRVSLWTKAITAARADDAATGPTSAPVKDLAAEAYRLWMAARLARCRFSPATEAMLESLRRAGFALALITNGSPEVQRPKLVACGADRFFQPDRVLVGGERAEAKPHPSIFIEACAAMGTAPEETVMVGDSLPADIYGAQLAGLRASIWVIGAKRERGQRASWHGAPLRPARVVRAAAEVPGLLVFRPGGGGRQVVPT
mmetsp:Transcript_26995/g.90360  ORF Transcript_26995/g.90360 Transcript_26995/m.90360 type:complete len:274 (+) Transcript_26995:99-920(+)